MSIDRSELKRLREAKGMTQADLARIAGVSQQLIGALESGSTKSTKFVYEIAKALDVPPNAIDQRIAETIVQDMRGLLENGNFRPPPKLITDEVMPLYAQAMGGDGAEIISTDPIDTVPTPHTLLGVKDAYAILITGESMVPAFRPGDVAWVDPRLPPMRDTEAIFYNVAEHGGEAHAMIKHLVKLGSSSWTVHQWNPDKTFELNRMEWNRCHRVVGRLSRR